MRIYCILNKQTGQKYIGQTTRTLKQRWKGHCASNSYCRYLSRAIKKFGKENFSIQEIRECSSIEELNFYEKLYIDHLDTLAPNGYNLTEGGESHSVSEETRSKMRVAHKNREAIFKQKYGDQIPWSVGSPKKPIKDQYGTIYPSLTYAARTLEIASSNIWRILKGKQNTAKGFSFQYV